MNAKPKTKNILNFNFLECKHPLQNYFLPLPTALLRVASILKVVQQQTNAAAQSSKAR